MRIAGRVPTPEDVRLEIYAALDAEPPDAPSRDALGAALRAHGAPARVVIGWTGNRPAAAMLDACPEAGELAWVPLQGGALPPEGAPWTRVFEGPEDPAIAPWMAEIEGYSLVCGSHRLVGPVRAAWLDGAKSDPWTLTDPT